MSTRAVFTFTDDHDGRPHHVYKHADGYPEGAAHALAEALGHAWPLPRFESDEFGAAFVAANKNRPGGIRLAKCWRDHPDLEYRYEIFPEETSLRIRALAVCCSYPENLWESRELFCGPLRAFLRKHGATAAVKDAAGAETIAACTEEALSLFPGPSAPRASPQT